MTCDNTRDGPSRVRATPVGRYFAVHMTFYLDGMRSRSDYTVTHRLTGYGCNTAMLSRARALQVAQALGREEYLWNFTAVADMPRRTWKRGGAVLKRLGAR